MEGDGRITDKPEWAECTKEEDYHRYMSDWKDEIVRHMLDGYGVLEWQYYQHMVNHAGWCPDCLRPDDGDSSSKYWQGRTLGKDEDGNYECFYCNEREANEND